MEGVLLSARPAVISQGRRLCCCAVFEIAMIITIAPVSEAFETSVRPGKTYELGSEE